MCVCMYVAQARNAREDVAGDRDEDDERTDPRMKEFAFCKSYSRVCVCVCVCVWFGSKALRDLVVRLLQGMVPTELEPDCIRSIQ